MTPSFQTQPLASDFNRLSDLEMALEGWARRHGGDRIVARALALTQQAVAQGHSCLALAQIPPALMSAERQAELRPALQASPLVGAPGASRPLILDGDRLYLQRYHAYEKRLAERLRALVDAAPRAVDVDKLRPGQGLFGRDADNPRATHWQAVAAFVALRHQFTVISGGPGTGKTHTIVRLLRVLIEDATASARPAPVIALAAPTGKAAARMLDSVRQGMAAMQDDPNFAAEHMAEHMPHKAQTLHRLLGLTGRTTQARFHADNPLPHDVVVVDEASMVDLPLMAKLADAIGPGARLILLGDRYQLASVESGAVLADICAAAGTNQFSTAQQQAAGALFGETATPGSSRLADHVVTLQTSRRFNADSAIGQLAAAVNNGEADTALAWLNAGHDDLAWQADTRPAAINQLVIRLAEAYADLCRASHPEEALARLGQLCVLTALRQGPSGSQTLNAGITDRLARRFGFDPGSRWFHGRPIMITQNDYRAGLYNGDVGVALYNEQQQIRLWFPGEHGPRAFMPSTLPAHDTVYAMTIHKSQGSEFDQVIMLMPDQPAPILSRELLYTGLTRARRQLTLLARDTIVRTTIQTRISRVSGLTL